MDRQRQRLPDGNGFPVQLSMEGDRVSSPLEQEQTPMDRSDPPSCRTVVRIDLHCHSMASTEADEALLLAINCPESYSHPEEVYAQAKQRGMRFVTITDHDSIEGVGMLCSRPDVLVGEELTCYFPEDGCKMHVLIWGITREDHDALQAVSKDIYKVARYIAARRIAHSVAHPLYRQNDVLEKWHIERLILLFKGFECLNGAHSSLHQKAFEPLLDELTPAEIKRLSRVHELEALWPFPHEKARTAGSDDHGLFNIGRTWTEFPAEVTSIEECLECLRTGRCAPGGEAGSSLKLAHNFFSVGVRFYSRQFVDQDSTPSYGGVLLQKLVGEKPRFKKRKLATMMIKRKLGQWGGKLFGAFRSGKAEAKGVDLLLELFMKSLTERLGDHPELTRALKENQAPLAEHEAIFSLISEINRDISAGIAGSVEKAVAQGELSGVFDVLGTIAAHQFVLMPYYFALFHQNRERHLFARLTGQARRMDASTMRVGIFTDTFDEVNGVTRFTRDIANQASRLGRHFVVHTSSEKATFEAAYRKNFVPLVSRKFPMYSHLELNLPPVAEVLEWCDRQQFDAIYVETPGPMGVVGMLAAAMLRVPVLGTYHTDFPAYVKEFTGDFRLTSACSGYMRWFYGRMQTVFSRTRVYQKNLRELGVSEGAMALAQPSVDMGVFNPSHRDSSHWQTIGVRESRQLFFCGRVSVEKNMPFLVEVFKRLCLLRKDTALVIAGDGPYRETMEKELDGLPAYFLGFQDEKQLASLYASADLFVFPSRTDTMGQVVLEAQASGLPVIVSEEGGPREMMAGNITGLMLEGTDPTTWVIAINDLLNDEPRRARMAHSGPPRMARFSVETMFEAFWNDHLKAVMGDEARRNEEGVGRGVEEGVEEVEVDRV